MSGHIIGRPDDDLLHIMLGRGADPEQAVISGSEQATASTTTRPQVVPDSKTLLVPTSGTIPAWRSERCR